MIYQRYFKNGQRLLLTSRASEQGEGRVELLTGFMDGGEDDTFILALPYSQDAADQFPFAEGMPFEISSEALGLGIRVSSTFEKKIDGRRIALKIKPDLQMFQRRGSPRLDCKLGIRFTRGQGALKSLRTTWEKNVAVLRRPNAQVGLDGFNTCQVNISAGGIRFPLRAPVSSSELCLMLIDLGDKKVPVCALAEIIWTRPEDQDENIISTGMRFINILEEDQKRIDEFITNRGGSTQEEDPA